MSGILAVVGAPVPPRAPELPEVARSLEQARLPLPTNVNCHEGTLRRTASALSTANTMLATPNAEQRLLSEPALVRRLRAVGDRLERAASEADGRLDRIAGALPLARLETTQRLLAGIDDALWTFRHDRLDRIDRLRNYLRTAADEPAIAPIWAVTGYSAIEIALRGIDRLEVSGRDSAGVHVWVRGSGVSRLITSARREIAARNDPLLTDRAVTVSAGGLGFTYKTAAPTGVPGDNARALREAVARDSLLARALHGVGAEVSVLAHTRSARVGKVSEANTCPVDGTVAGSARAPGPYTVAALDGVIDNHAELRARAGLDEDEEITTDGKLVPVLLSRNAGGHNGMLTALTRTVAALTGSFALAAQSARRPDALFLAVRGAARLCVGLSPAAWVVASEPMALASETRRYLTVAGTPGTDGAASGRIVVLRRDGVGDVAGLMRYNLEGNRYPVTAGELERVELRVRDADRGPFPHFLLKELAQSPDTVAKTLRGRIIAGPDGQRRLRLGKAAMSERIVDDVRSGRTRRLLFLGDAATVVACAGVATTARSLLGSRLRVSAVPAARLSALHPGADLRDCLLVAVSHAGASAAINHAVDRARALGATVLCLVNHRGSELAGRAHDVLYLSDARDDEMAAVATKSLYSQVAAGLMVTVELQRLLAISSKDDDAAALLASLEHLPEQIAKLVNSRGQPRFGGIDDVLVVPETHPGLAWLLSVVAGHLSAYEGAVALDEPPPTGGTNLAGGAAR